MHSIGLINAPFWLATIGALHRLDVGQRHHPGLMWRAINEGGTLTYSFVEALQASHPGYVVRMAGGGIFASGMLLMALNTWLTVRRRRDERAPRLRRCWPAERPNSDLAQNRSRDGPLHRAGGLSDFDTSRTNARLFLPSGFARSSPPMPRRRSGCAPPLGVAIVMPLVFCSGYLLVGSSLTLQIMGPAGASAVLIFVASSSPFAQPWAVLAGNLLAALIGISLGMSGLPSVASLALAACLSLLCLFYLRCLHPPSIALALVAAVGSPELHHLGFMLVGPVLFYSALLVAVALVYNNLTGHPIRSRG